MSCPFHFLSKAPATPTVTTHPGAAALTAVDSAGALQATALAVQAQKDAQETFNERRDNQVMTGLNLILPLKDPSKMGELMGKLQAAQGPTSAALRHLRDVHFARFLPAPLGFALQVVTAYDGELDAYALDFAQTIGDAFDLILGYVSGAESLLPVRDHPMAFMAFIRAHNADVGIFAATPKQTVVDIEGKDGMMSAYVDPTPVPVNRADVQANVIRGVRAQVARHVGLKIGTGALGATRASDAKAAQTFLAQLQDRTSGLPQITSDASWRADERPNHVLNIGFTFGGLANLGLPQAQLDQFALSFPAFAAGAADFARAQANGDIGTSDPVYWEMGGPNTEPVDMMLSINAWEESGILASYALLKAAWEAAGISEVAHFDAKTLGGSAKVHFGYEDSIAQPQLAISEQLVANQPGLPRTDSQPLAGVGEFLLGERYPNIYGGKDTLGGLPAALANNATFGAWRRLEQDVVGFETMLNKGSAQYGVDKEWLAAKLMGRWRNGTPLSLAPNNDTLPAGATLNSFDYAPTHNDPASFDDFYGEHCPVGAHIRRMNPRGSRVAGKPYSRRIIRRNMPYGDAYEAGASNPALPRGLMGYFHCVDLDRQFEFLLRQWSNGDAAVSGIRGTQDPIIGAQVQIPGKSSMSAQFKCLSEDGRRTLTLDMPRLVKTVAAAHVFLPGLGGLKYLSQLSTRSAMPVATYTTPAAQTAQAAKDAMRDSVGSALSLANTLAHQVGSGIWHAIWQRLDGVIGRAVDGVTRLWLRLFAPRKPAPAAPCPVDIATFNPETHIAFKRDPYPIYAWFRQNQPVVYFPALGNYWVFDHAAVTTVASAPSVFCKRAVGEQSPAGLFSMDPPYHMPNKQAIADLIDAIVNAPETLTYIQESAAALWRGLQGREVDFVADFIEPLNERIFFRIFGLSAADNQDLVAQVQKTVSVLSVRQSASNAAEVSANMAQVGALLADALPFAAKGGLLAGICSLPQFDAPDNTIPNSLGITPPPLLVEHLANASSIALGGNLPIEWLMQRAVVHLLEGDAVQLKMAVAQGATGAQCVDELVRFDGPVQMSNRIVHGHGVTVGGVLIPQNAVILVQWSSASRDETAFGPAADTLNFARGKGPGWGFGGKSEHHCLGQDLGTKVVGTVIDLLMKQVDKPPALLKPDAMNWAQGLYFRRKASIPMRFV